MSKLVRRTRQYTDEQRVNAGVLYAHQGSFSHVSRDTGTPRTTLIEWSKLELWDDAIVKARHQINDKILANNLEIATKAAERVLDSLENGDEKLVWDKNKNEYIKVRVKPTGKDASVMGGISQDKARVQLNLPTSIQGKSTDMQALAEEFRKLSRQWNEKQVNVVADQEKSEIE